MSKLDDLIEELCPNGVNYVQLNQFSKYMMVHITLLNIRIMAKIC